MRHGRRGLLAAIGAAMLLVLPACGDDEGGQRDSRTQMEIFAWWTGAGDGDGLAALIAEYEKQNQDVKVVNAAADGAGGQARQALAARLGNNPPDAYQLYAGQDAAEDIRAGRLEDLTYLYAQNGWKDKLPKGVLDAITVSGKIYSVPVNIHRSNLLWYNPAKLEEWGIAAPPKTWAEFLNQASYLRARGVTPLSVGQTWTQLQLLENVLLGELGPDAYAGLWNGRTDWTSAAVGKALETFRQVLAYADVTTSDWQAEAKRVLDGTAAYNVMVDWFDAYAGRDQKLTYGTDYAAVPTPGSGGVFNFLSDAFALPKGAPHKAAAEKWLTLVGSAEGQDLFNPMKRSVPARIDTDKSRYTGYLEGAQKDYRAGGTRLVGSLAHGVVVSGLWRSQIEKAYTVYFQDKNAAKFADAVKRAYTSAG